MEATHLYLLDALKEPVAKLGFILLQVRWPEGKKQVHEDYGASTLEEWHKKNGKFNLLLILCIFNL